jgi:hypothetical protein
MTRISKQGERRNRSPKRRVYKPPFSGEKAPQIPFKEKENAVPQELQNTVFIPKIK